MDLQDKVVLITGASSGIGAVAAVRFARAGADVALLARSRDGLERVAAQVQEHGRRALVLPCDVTDRPGLEAAVGQVIDEFGHLDVLVSNAAAVTFGRFEQVPPEEFDKTVDITFTGAVNVIRLCLPHLARSKGNMVVVGSIMTKVPLPTFSSYAASKHALYGFLNSLRIEMKLAEQAVPISLVNPGAVATPLWDHTTSHTGKQPVTPPDSYTPDAVARVIVACAQSPRHEVAVGGQVVLLDALWKFARPLGEAALDFAQRLYMSGDQPAGTTGSLLGGVGRGLPTGSANGRPSLYAPVRLAADAPIRMVRKVLTGSASGA
jgi:NAD(P)-dependent dehydrogenase (short-subunit alcohol dehydrogenase family)